MLTKLPVGAKGCRLAGVRDFQRRGVVRERKRGALRGLSRGVIEIK
jgi:hypothetical protein